jgi:hypothetical protein
VYQTIEHDSPDAQFWSEVHAAFDYPLDFRHKQVVFRGIAWPTQALAQDTWRSAMSCLIEPFCLNVELDVVVEVIGAVVSDRAMRFAHFLVEYLENELIVAA